jgi:hypothetical protein
MKSNNKSNSQQKSKTAKKVNKGKSKSNKKVFQGPHSVEIRHRELITQLQANGPLGLAATFEVNPGLLTTFPWLYVQANQYESYEFKKLSFEFEPELGSMTNGGLIAVPQYNVGDPSPSPDKALLSQYQNATQGLARNKMNLHLDLKSMSSGKSSHWVRGAHEEVTGDHSLYDVANVFFYTFGADTDVTIFGDVWVNYVVRLFNPQPNGDISEVLSTAKLAVTNFDLSPIEDPADSGAMDTSPLSVGATGSPTDVTAALFGSESTGLYLRQDGIYSILRFANPGIYQVQFSAAVQALAATSYPLPAFKWGSELVSSVKFSNGRELHGTNSLRACTDEVVLLSSTTHEREKKERSRTQSPTSPSSFSRT